MRLWQLSFLLLLLACANDPIEKPAAEKTTVSETTTTTTEVSTRVSDTSFAKDAETNDVPPVPVTKRPTGVYRFLLPYDGDKKLLHTIAFYGNTYRLQEEYNEKRDSVVVTEGTWAPSQGFIWLYKDQVLRGRYAWKGDTLQYFNPQQQKRFSLEKLQPASSNNVWQAKKAQGDILYAVGNEPFWSLDLLKSDSLVLNMPDWTEPLRLPLAATEIGKDSTVYVSAADSLRLTVYPYFCSDGMSDFLYNQKIKIVYRGQVYKGCGETFAQD